MCIDWEQLDTGNCHQNADLQKSEQALVRAKWSRQYGFVDAVSLSGTQYQTDAVVQERLRHLGQAFVHLGSFHLILH